MAESAGCPQSSGPQKCAQQQLQRIITSIVPTTVAKVAITGEMILNACVELCTVNGRPFALMEDYGFRKLTDPVPSGLNSKVAINAENVRAAVQKKANEMPEQIRKEIKGKLVSLKAVSPTRTRLRWA
ncbi:hypothetical protein HPB50_005182 [Hyalomma asiaticum]|uniref:Uncharacterized protein n=1 Tax=Hyalomma asiaticum TaxID=266040 RepID=A0ACB7S0T3_HYAAI|nr:hypothetical protein HPB50_005182 [Hyalomma asiaticum]